MLPYPRLSTVGASTRFLGVRSRRYQRAGEACEPRSWLSWPLRRYLHSSWRLVLKVSALRRGADVGIPFDLSQDRVFEVIRLSE